MLCGRKGWDYSLYLSIRFCYALFGRPRIYIYQYRILIYIKKKNSNLTYCPISSEDQGIYSLFQG